MPKPPSNYRVGQERGVATQMKLAKQRDTMIWDALVTIAIMREPRTYAAYIPHLTALKIASRTGKPWTPQLVGAEFKKHGVSAKKLLDRVTHPSPFEKRRDWPVATHKAFIERLEVVDGLSPENGVWRPATEREPLPSDIVRHAMFGEGQVVRQVSLARYLCSFVVGAESQTAECPASEIDVFTYRLSKEQRIAASKRLRERLFRKP